MSPEEYIRESGDLRGTELTLALPGTSIIASEGRQKSRNKRSFIETIDLKLGERHVTNSIAFNNLYGILKTFILKKYICMFH